MPAIIRAVMPYLILAVLAAASVAGVFAYVKHLGAVAAERKALSQQVSDLRGQLKAEIDAVAKAAAAREQQQKDVSNVRKEVDAAYRAGLVPDRVRKFYID